MQLVFKPWKTRSTRLLLGCLILLLSACGWPFNQQDKKTLTSFFTSDRNLFSQSIKDDWIQKALEDRSQLVNPLFKVPPSLRPNVEFWLKTYTQYSSLDRVFYDRLHPELIYEVVDLRPLWYKAKSNANFELNAKNLINSKLKQYAKAFQNIKTHSSRKNALTPFEKNLYQRILATNQHQHSLDSFHKNLRIQTGQRDSVIRGLSLSDVYLPKMKSLFEMMDVPGDLAVLSLVESSFNSQAESKVGALGVWQFMEGSAREYLFVNESTDERLSPLKSTVAAAHLLKRNYNYFDSWPLAITSYNHGFTGLKKFKENDLSIFELCSGAKKSKKSNPLGFASKNYYSEFLALLHATTYSSVFYGKSLNPQQSRDTRPQFAVSYRELDYSMNLSEMSKSFKTKTDLLLKNNPDILTTQKKVPSGFMLALPSNQDYLLPIVSHVKKRSKLFLKVALNADKGSTPRSFTR